MREHSVTSKQLSNGCTVSVYYDTEPGSPREWDNAGTVVLVDRCRYDFGDERMSYEGIQEIVDAPENITLPVYMYDHSGISINTSGFSCPWDSGQVGVIYISKADAIKEWGKKVCSAKVRQRALDCLRGEIETLNQYLTGQVYGYVVTDPQGVESDSCWGFYGDSDDCMQEGIRAAEWTPQMSLPLDNPNQPAPLL